MARWHCTACGTAVADAEATVDPRYGLGLCRYCGKRRVVTDEARARAAVDHNNAEKARREARRG